MQTLLIIVLLFSALSFIYFAHLQNKLVVTLSFLLMLCCTVFLFSPRILDFHQVSYVPTLKIADIKNVVKNVVQEELKKIDLSHLLKHLKDHSKEIAELNQQVSKHQNLNPVLQTIKESQQDLKEEIVILLRENGKGLKEDLMDEIALNKNKLLLALGKMLPESILFTNYMFHYEQHNHQRSVFKKFSDPSIFTPVFKNSVSLSLKDGGLNATDIDQVLESYNKLSNLLK